MENYQQVQRNIDYSNYDQLDEYNMNILRNNFLLPKNNNSKQQLKQSNEFIHNPNLSNDYKIQKNQILDSMNEGFFYLTIYIKL